jgi:hypothetical protein
MLAKNFATFCPCPETLREANFKGKGLINVAEEISRYPGIQAVSQVLLSAFS